MTENVVPLKKSQLAVPLIEEQADTPPDFYFMTPEYERVLAVLPDPAEYHPEVILVCGAKGCGKTALLKQYLKRNDRDWDLCMISPRHVIGEKHLLAELNQAFFPGCQFALKEFIDQLAGGAELLNHPLIIIDDAQNLSSFALEVLLSIKHAVEARGARVSVLLLADGTIRSTLATPSLLKFDATIRIIDMPILTEEQAWQFLHQWLEVHGITEQQFPLSVTRAKAIHYRARGMPSYMMELVAAAVEQQMAPDFISLWRKRLSQPRNMIGLVATVLLALIALAVMTNDQENRAALTAPPVLSTALEEIDQLAGHVKTVEDDHARTAPPARPSAPEKKTIVAKTTPQPVVRASAAASQPAARQSEQKPASTPAVKQPVNDKPDNAATDNTPRREQVAAGTRVTAAPVAETRPAESATPVQGNAWLMSQDGKAYTIQLAASAYEDAIIRFIKKQPATPELRYVHVQRRGKDWYTVLYGAYVSASQARDIVDTLPRSLVKNQPWVRRISALQNMTPKPEQPAKPATATTLAIPARADQQPEQVAVPVQPDPPPETVPAQPDQPPQTDSQVPAAAPEADSAEAEVITPDEPESSTVVEVNSGT